MSTSKIFIAVGSAVAGLIIILFATRGFTIREMIFVLPLLLVSSGLAWYGTRLEDSKPWQPPED